MCNFFFKLVIIFKKLKKNYIYISFVSHKFFFFWGFGLGPMSSDTRHWTHWDCNKCLLLDTCHHLTGSSALETLDPNFPHFFFFLKDVFKCMKLFQSWNSVSYITFIHQKIIKTIYFLPFHNDISRILEKNNCGN